MSDSQNLSVKRKADRAAMATRVVNIALACGATCQRQEGGEYPGPRRIIVSVQAPGGLQVNVSLDGDSTQPGVFVLPWHMSLESNNKLNPAFGEVNPYHFRKATHVAHGFEEACEQLRFGLEMCADGQAYQAPATEPSAG